METNKIKITKVNSHNIKCPFCRETLFKELNIDKKIHYKNYFSQYIYDGGDECMDIIDELNINHNIKCDPELLVGHCSRCGEDYIGIDIMITKEEVEGDFIVSDYNTLNNENVDNELFEISYDSDIVGHLIISENVEYNEKIIKIYQLYIDPFKEEEEISNLKEIIDFLLK